MSTCSLLFVATVPPTACRNWYVLCGKGACRMDPPARYYDGPRFPKSSKRKQSHSNSECVWCSTTSGPILQYANCSDPQSSASELHRQMTAHWQMTKAILTDDRNKCTNFVTYKYNYGISVRTTYRRCWMSEQEDQSSRPSVVMKQHAPLNTYCVPELVHTL